MRVVLSTRGRFHSFDLARQIEKRAALTAIYTGYPRFKLKGENIPSYKIRTFPWFQTVYMGLPKLGRFGELIEQDLAWWAERTLDAYVAATMPECEIFMGLSGSSYKAGLTAKRRGAKYVCDHGSSHVHYLNGILSEEYAKYGAAKKTLDPRNMDDICREFEIADIITVPSSFAFRSFISCGIPAHKLRKISYGVDLGVFQPTAAPSEGAFDVLFVGYASFRKGVPYLLQAVDRLDFSKKTLSFAGEVDPFVGELIERYSRKYRIELLGHLPKDRLKSAMSTAHVMVLPSLEEGLALVQAQALACGCPVIGTTNSGAEDLFVDGVEGFIVPIRDPDAITSRLQLFLDKPGLRQEMSRAALRRVEQLGGWDSYGTQMFEVFESLLSGPLL